MKVLVTGGAGYVGTELVSALARREEVGEIVVYDNLARNNHNLFIADAMPQRAIRFVHGDILDTRRLRRELDGADVVFHLAARVTTPFADQDFHGLDQVNHWGTAELSYLLEANPVKKVVYTSSTSVYGASEGRISHAQTPDPRTAYGISKHRGERMLERLQGDMDLYVARLGNVYGYNKSMRFDAVINRFMFEAHFNRRITLHGSGEQQRAFVHVRNAARVLLGMAFDGVEPGIYDVVERNMPVLSVAQQVSELYPELEMIFIQQDRRLRNLLVDSDDRLDRFELFDRRSFADQLREFRGHFAFSPA